MATTGSTTAKINQEILDSLGHPSLLINAVTNRIESLSEGLMANVDPNNSVAVLTEAMANLGSGLMLATTAETRRIYKSGVTNIADLYRHMSDYDFHNRFSRPVTDVPFVLMFDYNINESCACNSKLWWS